MNNRVSINLDIGPNSIIISISPEDLIPLTVMRKILIDMLEELDDRIARQLALDLSVDPDATIECTDENFKNIVDILDATTKGDKLIFKTNFQIK